MKTKITALVIMFFSFSVFAEGYLVTSDLWIKAVINTVEKGQIEAVWQKGGEDTTSRGDRVIWGHFYASPSDVTWGSQDNPDLYVKIWFDVSGRVDVNFFHVSVPDIVVYSDYPYDGTPDEQGTTTMSRRYIRQFYESGQSYSEENYEDGLPAPGYSPANNPFGYSTINNLRFGAMINTVERGSVEAVWRLGGQDTTARGDQVVWGHFYADPSDVTWGNEDNPELFVKIWFDVSGRIDVNFFHVSVPDIEVYSDYPDDGTYDQKGTTIIPDRYIRHEYCSGDITPEKCANIAGTWHGCEEGTITCTAAGETVTEEISGCSTINIEQNGCEVRWEIQGYERAGTIDGNYIHVSGIFVVPLVSGFSFTQNIYTAEGTISGDKINLNGSGIASGTFCDEDGCYNFSCTGSSIVTLTRDTGTYQSSKTIKETDIPNGGPLFIFGITNSESLQK
jgi:hypothetical protein